MSWTVKGVVALAEKKPAELVDVVIPDPGPNDVVVDIEATGVCHTDLAYRDGGINDEFPFLLGHESAGRVSAVGEHVTHVEVGDYVVLNWRAVCGQCRACKKGVLQYCFDTHNASRPMTLTDGTELTAALGIGSFAEKTLVHEGQCTKVSEDAPAEVAGLLGCGVMAGIGAAINTGQVQRGESLAVIGLGGVGCAAIAGAKLAGATTHIGLDLAAQKLAAADERGAELVKCLLDGARPGGHACETGETTSSSMRTCAGESSTKQAVRAMSSAVSIRARASASGTEGRWSRKSVATSPGHR